MVSPTVKLTAIALGVGGVTVGAGVGIYNSLSKSDEKKQDNNKQETPTKVAKKSIVDLLTKDGKQLLKKGEKAKWDPLWKNFRDKYKNANTEPKDPWKITNWEQEKSKDVAPDEFQTKCIENAKGEVDDPDSELYKIIKDYCTENKTQEIQS